MTLPPPCFTDEIVCFGSRADPFFLYTLSFPSLPYRLIWVWSVHKTLLQNFCGSSLYFANCNLTFRFVLLMSGLHVVKLPCRCSRSLEIGWDPFTPALWTLWCHWLMFWGFSLQLSQCVCHQLLSFSLVDLFDVCCSVCQRFLSISGHYNLYKISQMLVQWLWSISPLF